MNKLKSLSAFAFALAFAGTSFAAGEDIIGKYGAITIKKVMVERQVNGQNTQVEWKVAYIDDSSDETPVITEDIEVDSVYYSRVFKDTVSSTLMLRHGSWAKVLEFLIISMSLRIARIVIIASMLEDILRKWFWQIRLMLLFHKVRIKIYRLTWSINLQIILRSTQQRILERLHFPVATTTGISSELMNALNSRILRGFMALLPRIKIKQK